MDSIKTILIFFVAGLGELGGTYAVWRWRREGAAPWLSLIGLGALLFYAVIQTYQPESGYGRLYAAYGGYFLAAAMMWGWLVDGLRPDRFDFIGVAIALVGMGTILWGRQLFG